LYIDEIDAIARSRSASAHEHSAQLVAQLLVLLDGVDAKTDDAPKVVASTNLTEVLDPALLRPGRLGNQPITFSRPTTTERKAIVHHYLEQIRTSDEGQLNETLHKAVTNPCESTFLEDISGMMEGYTGADIEDTLIDVVTRLQASDNQETSALSASSIRKHVQQRDQQEHRTNLSEDVITKSESPPVQLTGDGKAVVVDQNTSKEGYRAIAARQAKQAADTDQAIFRSVRADKLLGADELDTHDRVVASFHNDDPRPLCLHLSGLDPVIQSSDRTPLAATVIQAIHEEVLRWEQKNTPHLRE